MDINTYHNILQLSVFVLGACTGSFLNVCIYRIPEGKSIIFPGSHCTACNTSIPFYYNIPVLSYIFLLGRCNFCKKRFSIRYPLVELLSAFFALGLFYKFGLSPAFIFWFIFINTLIVISFIDLDHMIIPDVISLPGILIFSSAFIFIPGMSFKNSIIGVLSGGGLLYLVAFLYYAVKKLEGLGGGDIKLLAMIGAATGLKGVIVTVFIGSLLGTFIGISIMISTKIYDIKLKIPFGPYLALGSIIYIFFGNELISWYLDQFVI